MSMGNPIRAAGRLRAAPIAKGQAGPDQPGTIAHVHYIKFCLMAYLFCVCLSDILCKSLYLVIFERLPLQGHAPAIKPLLKISILQ